jgi:transcriptional regulator with XRE-family HTH domain
VSIGIKVNGRYPIRQQEIAHLHPIAENGIHSIVTPALCQKILSRMSEKGFDRRSLSLAAGLNESYVSQYLLGRIQNPGIDGLSAVAAKLDWPVSELRSEEPALPDAPDKVRWNRAMAAARKAFEGSDEPGRDTLIEETANAMYDTVAQLRLSDEAEVDLFAHMEVLLFQAVRRGLLS